jgi:hypothetical protein
VLQLPALLLSKTSLILMRRNRSTSSAVPGSRIQLVVRKWVYVPFLKASRRPKLPPQRGVTNSGKMRRAMRVR